MCTTSQDFLKKAHRLALTRPARTLARPHAVVSSKFCKSASLPLAPCCADHSGRNGSLDRVGLLPPPRFEPLGKGSSFKTPSLKTPPIYDRV